LELENFNPGDLVKEIVDRFVDLHPDVPLTLRIEAEAIGLWGPAASGPGRLEHHIQRHKVWSTEAN
jgi:hypothetical protein